MQVVGDWKKERLVGTLLWIHTIPSQTPPFGALGKQTPVLNSLHTPFLRPSLQRRRGT